jgi:hypothetical protein
VNREELENSLRTEFESYLKTVVAETRQEISQLQEKVENQLEKHKEQLDVVFQEAFTKVNADRELDPGFRESVIEHLSLSRDEGARITAAAMAEADKLKEETKPEVVDNSAELSLKFRDAVYEISSMSSQAEILKTLVRHAENFASRGAFFIIKNEHFVGWRTFGVDKPENDSIIREIFFSTSLPTLIGSSVKSNRTEHFQNVDYQDSSLYLDKIGYQSPINQVAIPLVVRGRGVAVLYADGEMLNNEVLESLVRIAGLTVDLLASSRPQGQTQSQKPAAVEVAPIVAPIISPVVDEVPDTKVTSSFEEPTERYEPVETVETIEEETKPIETAFVPYVPVEVPHFDDFETTKQSGFDSELADITSVEPEATTETFGDDKYKEFEQTTSWDEPKYEIEDTSKDFEVKTSEATEEFSFEPTKSFEPASQFDLAEKFDFEAPKTTEYSFEPNVAEVPAVEKFEDFSSTQNFAKNDFESYPKTEELVPFEVEKTATFEPEVVTSPAVADVAVKPRFSDRNVDLPIDVAEDERRLHNDARRFARLLVSEIKLYNEQKVKEGRESNDLYERLKEAIDRSREMYDKRVQPPVAAKFDYFHYELVNTLGESEESKLGSGYPGATV